MYNQIASNKRKTVLLIAVFIALVSVLAWFFSTYFLNSSDLTLYILGGAVAYVLVTYYTGSSLALAVNGAKAIEKRDNPRLWRIVENLAITDGLPMPKVYIMDDPAPNAFATGRNPNRSAVAVTSGLLEIMSDTELEGVLAHELGHVKNYDIRVSLIAFALVAVVGLIADTIMRFLWFGGGDDDNNGGNGMMFIIGLVGAILAPLTATLIQLAISRKREFLADATGALTTRYPEGLASALEKIGPRGGVLKRQNTSTAHLFFASPLKGKNLASLFSTHPPIEERVARLRHMESNA